MLGLRKEGPCHFHAELSQNIAKGFCIEDTSNEVYVNLEQYHMKAI